jgi:uncharacterized protein (TIGR03435 family)
LKERFHLQVHRETKSPRVYHLLVAKNGPNLKSGEKRDPIESPQERRKVLEALSAQMQAKRDSLGFRPTDSIGVGSGTMEELVGQLSPYLDRPVVERTQLDGVYAFNLHWVNDRVQQKDDAPQGPSLFAALQEQLGLELKPATEPLELLVVDGAEKTPTEN